MRRTLTLLALALSLAAAGCGSGLGPSKLAPSRMDYNLAVQQSSNEEMLLNIVRMKYFEQPLFLQVGSIASTFNYQFSGGATVTVPEMTSYERGIVTNYAPTFTASYTDAPTVTYTPYQGQSYAQQFLAECDFDRLVILYKSGWDIEFLLRILVNRIGNLYHSYDSRKGFADEDHEKFVRLSRLFGEMDDEGRFGLVQVQAAGNSTKATVLSLHFRNEEEARTVADLLGAPPEGFRTHNGQTAAKFLLTPVNEAEVLPASIPARKYPVLYLSLRNGLRAVDILAQGVETPPERRARSERENFRAQFQDLCDIRVSRDKPGDAYVAVRHEGYWYFIRRDDDRSKEVFQLLLNIFALQSADPPKNAPVLTLPVGGG